MRAIGLDGLHADDLRIIAPDDRTFQFIALKSGWMVVEAVQALYDVVEVDP